MEELAQTKTQQVTTSAITPPVTPEQPQRVYEKKKVIFRTYQVIWYILAVVEVLLGFRFALKMFGANPFSGFTNLIYTISAPLAYPFSGILPTAVFGGSTFEWSTGIAAIVYAILAYGIVYLFQIIKPVTPTEVSRNVDNP